MNSESADAEGLSRSEGVAGLSSRRGDSVRVA